MSDILFTLGIALTALAITALTFGVMIGVPLAISLWLDRRQQRKQWPY